MDAKLVGIHEQKYRRKDGGITYYYYAWRGGPRMKSKPGTLAFTQEFVRLTKERTQEPAKTETLAWLIDQYRESADYQKLKPSTRRDYERIMGVLRHEYKTMPVGAIEAKGARRMFLAWRDSMRERPRSADMHISVLARIFSWAHDREIIVRNPLTRVGNLHSGSRKDSIWQPTQLASVLKNAPAHIADVVKIALWTMQRQGDILTMPTMAYADGRLWITQAKTGARVSIQPAEEIIPILERAKAENRQRILQNSFKQHWTSDGFRASFRKVLSDLKITGVRFHDLRGTGITYAHAHGMDIEQIADISGHSKKECDAVIRKYYLAGGDVFDAIRKGTTSE